jgi:hypothetical protein
MKIHWIALTALILALCGGCAHSRDSIKIRCTIEQIGPDGILWVTEEGVRMAEPLTPRKVNEYKRQFKVGQTFSRYYNRKDYELAVSGLKIVRASK